VEHIPCRDERGNIYRTRKTTAVPTKAAAALDAIIAPFLIARAPLVGAGEDPEDEELVEGDAEGFTEPVFVPVIVFWPVGATDWTIMEEIGCPDVSQALTNWLIRL